MSSLSRMPLLSRRTLLVAAASIALAGCGDDSAAGSAGPMRAVKDIDGKQVMVPQNPQRVVALSEPALDGLLSLGIEPVGTVSGRGQRGVPNYLAKRAGKIPIIGQVANPNYEAIGAVRPDLLIVDGTSINNNQRALDTLSQIAPLVYTGYAGGDWRVTFGNVANAVGRSAEGKKVLEKYDTRAAGIKERLAKHGYADATFSIVRWQGSAPSLILKELLAGRALQDVGLRRPPAQDREGRGHSEPVSLENLSDIDADYMFFGTLGGSSVTNRQANGSADIEAAKKALQAAMKVPGFAQLKAVRENHVITIDGSVWTSTGGPILMNDILSDIERELLEKR